MTIFARLTDAQYADMMEALNSLQVRVFCDVEDSHDYQVRVRAYTLTDGTTDWVIERRLDGTEYWLEAGTEPDGDIEDESRALMTVGSAVSAFPEDFDRDEDGQLIFASSRKPATPETVEEEYDFTDAGVKTVDLDPFIA